MRITGSTTTLAFAAALLIELLNYFFVGYPAGAHRPAVPTDWFVAVAAQWDLLHLPGIFALNRFAFLRDHMLLGAIVLFLSGWLDTALLLAACIWPIQLLLKVLRRSLRPLNTEN